MLIFELMFYSDIELMPNSGRANLDLSIRMLHGSIHEAWSNPNWAHDTPSTDSQCSWNTASMSQQRPISLVFTELQCQIVNLPLSNQERTRLLPPDVKTTI